jgi:uncharacterized protein (TIGR02246 family)
MLTIKRGKGSVSILGFVGILVLVMIVLRVPAVAGPKEDVAAATQAWVDAFGNRNLDQVVALYDAEAVLWGTVEQKIRDNPAAISDYFKLLSSLTQAKVVVGEQRIRVYGDTAINTGYYTFTLERDGQPRTFPARFSFTYHKRDGRWMIVDHHSSMLPQPPR